MEDEIVVSIVAEVGNKKSYKSIKDYTNFLETKINEAFDTSILNKLDEAGKKWNALVKVGRKYREATFITTKKGKLKSFNIGDKEYSLAEARKLMSASSISGVKTLRSDIQLERKKAKERERIKKQKEKEPPVLTNEEIREAEAEALKKANTDKLLKENKIQNLANIIGSTLNGIDLTKHQIKTKNQEIARLKKEFLLVKEGTTEYDELANKIKNAQNELNDLVKKLKEQNQELKDSKKLSGFQKLINTFKRVGFYRIARRVFQVIEQGLSQGIEQLTRFDSQTNKTMSSISSSFDKISSSIALIFKPAFDVIEPVLSSISKFIAEFANDISLATAKMKGLATYTKINTEYMKDLQASAKSTLFSFDKFESANGEENPFETAIVDDKEADKALEKFKGVFDFLNAIKELLITIWDFAKLILDFALNDIVGISNALGIVSEVLNQITSIIGVITSLLKGDFAGAWEYLKNFGISCINFLIKGVNALWDSMLRMVQLTLDVFVNPIVSLFGKEKIEIPRGKLMIPTFANGGRPTQGSLFYAGEAGAELITTMPSGQTGVTNIAQFKQAMVEALYECSDIFQQPNGSVVLNLDGAEIARSKNFKNELNRTNSGLNLR